MPDFIAQRLPLLKNDPGATATLLDSGAQVAGTYRVEAHLSYMDAAQANRTLVLVHRNAADNGDVQILATFPARQTLSSATRAPQDIPDRVAARLTLATNERVVVRTGSQAASNAGQATGELVLTRLS